ncbi:hypothetical protein RJ640_012014 [Escallonia rubra]|uniref:Lipase-like PAD4 n=1 Tax=Escallonia rubra TaxID=112253 RepID=A0AA88R7R5_9ASTE|nr:hypothetical protein RJ640_012014 [Escallonia rubra]
MEAEASTFETCEMLATFLASTPLLSDSWKLCSHANATAPQGFVANQVEDVCYVAFSGVQAVTGWYPGCRNLVPLDTSDNGPFSAWRRQGEEEEPVMVHAGFLHMFLSTFHTESFQTQIFEIMKRSKSVVFTGHSIGAPIASLSALWFLSHFQSVSSSPSVICITFGSPLLGNKSLSRAILQERWGGNFWHVVARHDIVPRLLFAPLTPHLHFLLQLWHLCMPSPYLIEPAVQLHEHQTSELFRFVSAYVEASTREEGAVRPLFCPFGNFMFCSNEGAVCVDNEMAIVKLLHVMFVSGSAGSSITDHFDYGDYFGKVSLQFLCTRGFMEGDLPESSYEAGVELALQSSEIPSHVIHKDSLFQFQKSKPMAATRLRVAVSGLVKDCLKMAKRMGLTPNLNSAGVAIALSKITPLRAQIEWYKASCDDSDDQMGYYDSFKQRGASKRDFKVNMNRIKLAQFWDDLIGMLETNQLSHDFHKRAKYVNASQFYKLLVEPLDIAEYYRSGMHRVKGHYIKHGRDKRYEIFDKWWGAKKVFDEESNKRSTFASLTQDSCFWARLEEAREWLEIVRTEGDTRKLCMLWENIDKFEQYARRMVEKKEVSIDVLARNSSYSLWIEELKELRLHLQQFPPSFPRLLDGRVVP